MPKEEAQATSLRRLKVLEVIQALSGTSRRWVTVSDVTKALKQEGYQVESYSVRRDLEALARFYDQLECNDNGGDSAAPKSGLAYGYRWYGPSRPPESGLSLAEAVSLAMVERYLGQALPSTLTGPLRSLFDKAARTLELHRKSPMAHWPDKIAEV